MINQTSSSSGRFHQHRALEYYYRKEEIVKRFDRDFKRQREHELESPRDCAWRISKWAWSYLLGESQYLKRDFSEFPPLPWRIEILDGKISTIITEEGCESLLNRDGAIIQ